VTSIPPLPASGKKGSPAPGEPTVSAAIAGAAVAASANAAIVVAVLPLLMPTPLAVGTTLVLAGKLGQGCRDPVAGVERGCIADEPAETPGACKEPRLGGWACCRSCPSP
jgi:hypothetical protein